MNADGPLIVLGKVKDLVDRFREDPRGLVKLRVRAVSNGSVVDYRSAGAMLQHVIARVCGRQRIFRPDVMLAVPSTLRVISIAWAT